MSDVLKSHYILADYFTDPTGDSESEKYRLVFDATIYFHGSNMSAYTKAVNDRNNYKAAIRDLEKQIATLGYTIEDGTVSV